MIRYEAVLILKELLKDDLKRRIHISVKNRRFYNDVVVDYSCDENISFKDDKLGHIPIFYKYILNIEPFVRNERWVMMMFL